MKEYGFVRVAALTPSLKVGNTIYNTDEIIKELKKASDLKIDILTTPELSITGYTCADLFSQDVIIDEAIKSLDKLMKATETINTILIVGVPLRLNNQLFNCAAVINKGIILGIVPKTYIPNYNEFYEKRWFSSSLNTNEKYIELFNQKIPFGTNLIFKDINNKNIAFSIEICEDAWCHYPPSLKSTLNGATIIFNLSASNELIGKYQYRKELIKGLSAREMSAYIYASSGINESSTDLVFSGHSMIYENGVLLEENKRFDFDSNLIYNDIDVERLMNNRYKNISYMGVNPKDDCVIINLDLKDNDQKLKRHYDKYPFVPSSDDKKDERCKEIFNILVSALAKRLKHTNINKTVIGISGGLDSTLAFLIIVEAFKKLNLNSKDIIAVTMPGFGTTNRTLNNAIELVKDYDATLKTIDIKEACLIHMKDLGIKENDRSVTFENIQARERTQILMDLANKENALVIGTGDLSELALGWCTYNGDHMSMYAINNSIPKTLVKYLVRWIADYQKESKAIYDILDTPVSPELLPPDKNGKIVQITEDKIGPYMLHDFFLYHFLRYGASPKKILFMATETFKEDYTKEEIKKWLKVFITRFFTQQFKRSCIPDGPKVGTISLSPRGDLRMPSDASYELWINDLKEI